MFYHDCTEVIDLGEEYQRAAFLIISGVHDINIITGDINLDETYKSYCLDQQGFSTANYHFTLSTYCSLEVGHTHECSHTQRAIKLQFLLSWVSTSGGYILKSSQKIINFLEEDTLYKYCLEDSPTNLEFVSGSCV